MAEFTADLNPKGNTMSLGDMMKVGLYSAETAIANRQAQLAEQKVKEMPIIQQWAQNPDNKLEDGSFDLKQIPALISVAPISGPEYADKIIGLTKNHIETNKALNELSESNRKPFASVYGSYAAMTQNGQKVTPTEIINSLETLKQYYPQLAKAADGQIKGWQAYPTDHAVNPQMLFKARNESLSPTQLIDQFAPKAEVTTIGGAQRPVVRQPSVMGETPTITPTGFGGEGAKTTQEKAPEGGGKLPKLVDYGNLKYTGDPSLFNLNEAQKTQYETGDKTVNSIGASLKAARDIQQPIRKVEEFVNSATGSKLRQTLQAGGKFAFGNADLDSLIKNIAQVQARNAEVMGLSKTDHMQELNSKLSGSEQIDSKALAGVMQQVKADAVAAEKYNLGLQKFVEKHGDINGRILAQKFQSAWAEHYDPRIFQIQNIENSQLSEKEKDARIREIHSTMNEKEFKALENDAKVLYRLEKGMYQ
jgi:hypothetical protein